MHTRCRGHRLVLTPWDALVRQLIRDVDRRFWEIIGVARPAGLPAVKRLPPSSRIEDIEGAVEPTVFVATIAAIDVMESACQREGRTLESVFGGFNLVFVDEGHYEPAHHWSQAIRALSCPTVLLTATPYRNDVKYFEVGEFRYRYTYHEAVDARFLRRPEFANVSRGDISTFAREPDCLGRGSVCAATNARHRPVPRCRRDHSCGPRARGGWSVCAGASSHIPTGRRNAAPVGSRSGHDRRAVLGASEQAHRGHRRPTIQNRCVL